MRVDGASHSIKLVKPFSLVCGNPDNRTTDLVDCVCVCVCVCVRAFVCVCVLATRGQLTFKHKDGSPVGCVFIQMSLLIVK